jgi:transposase-like protein
LAGIGARGGQEVPAACPSCKSTLISTTAKNPAVDCYWRCDQCGEVWNSGRSRPTPPRSTAYWR